MVILKKIDEKQSMQIFMEAKGDFFSHGQRAADACAGL